MLLSVVGFRLLERATGKANPALLLRKTLRPLDQIVRARNPARPGGVAQCFHRAWRSKLASALHRQCEQRPHDCRLRLRCNAPSEIRLECARACHSRDLQPTVPRSRNGGSPGTAAGNRAACYRTRMTEDTHNLAK